MKVVYAMVHVEAVCPKCGGTMTRLAKAKVTEDGRIGEVVNTLEDLGDCNRCRDTELRIERREYYEQRNRKAWANKQAKKLGAKS